MADGAPLKYIDIKDAVMGGVRAATPNSLAFMLPSVIQPVPADFDRRRLPFNDISPLLRDQRQRSLANPPQNTPFSIWNAFSDVRRMKNRDK